MGFAERLLLGAPCSGPETGNVDRARRLPRRDNPSGHTVVIVPVNENSPLTTAGGAEMTTGVDEPQVMLMSALF